MRHLIKKILPSPVRRLLGGNGKSKRAENPIYRERDYIDAYIAHTDMRVEEDPEEAIGGMWETIGTLQFDFLKANGLETRHKMLDFGCGTLRGGIHFIPYLDAGNYTGMDISKGVIEAGKKTVADRGLSEKKPDLIYNDNPALPFGRLPDRKYDVILAQSVFTHLPREFVDKIFSDVGDILADDGRFFFTFTDGDRYEHSGTKHFRYPFPLLAQMAERYGYSLENRSADYVHPRKQSMAVLKKRNS